MKHRNRLIFIAVLVFAWAGLLISRLVTLQVFRSEELSDRAERQYQQKVVLTPKRGTVFDRNGRTMAINVDAPSLYAIGADVTDPAAAAAALSPILGRPKAEIERILSQRKGFTWLQRKIGVEQRESIEALGIDGLHFVTESKRVYPAGRLACHVLGFAGIDNDGLAGLEYEYDEYLRGQPGLMLGIRGAKGGYLFSAGKIVTRPTGGHDVTLTLDYRVQNAVEAELGPAVEAARAHSGTVIVMDHESGEILAMANYPDFDPNDYGRFDAFARKNRAVVDAYEPGSTFKIVTTAAALELNLVDLAEVIDCGNGAISIGSRVIRDHHSYDELPFREVFEKSSNVGVIRIGLRLEEQRLHEMAAAFGYGSQCGIDLPAENPGLLRPVSKWTEGSIGSISIGQEVSANPVQILLMGAAVANGGYWVKPYIVASVTEADGRVDYTAQPERRRIFSERTAALLREMTRGVVLSGTGEQAEIAGIPVAGKTGTGEVSAPRGGYIPGAYLSSFLGYLPYDKPRLTMICMIDRPKGKYYGGDVAAPLFRSIGERLARVLEIDSLNQDYAVLDGIPQEENGGYPAATGRPAKRVLSQPDSALVMPNLSGLSLREAIALLAEIGIVPVVEGEGGRVVGQTPSPGEPIGGRTVIRCGGTGIADNRMR